MQTFMKDYYCVYLLSFCSLSVACISVLFNISFLLINRDFDEFRNQTIFNLVEW
jgi:hypothetical protein